MHTNDIQRLFPNDNFPLHRAWVALVTKNMEWSGSKWILINKADVNRITNLMGDEYADALKRIITSNPKENDVLLSTLLPLKVAARKRLELNQTEFTGDCTQIRALLSEFVAVGTSSSLNPQYREELQRQKLNARRELSEKMFAEMKLKKEQYEKEYIDYPALRIFNIRRRSKAAGLLNALTNGKLISGSDYSWLIRNKFDNEHLRELYSYIQAQNREEVRKQKLKASEKDHIDYPALRIFNVRRRSKAAGLLNALTNGKLISGSDYSWLILNKFDTEHLRELYSYIYAKKAEKDWFKKRNPWDLVNAISNYRKANKSERALNLVEKHYPFKFAKGNKNVRSALLTTSGGVKRDIGMLNEAIKLGAQAHDLTNQDYRPCTLIGACYMLTGAISKGNDWYQKAMQRGFNEDSFEEEMRSLYNRAKPDDKQKMKKILIADGWHYGWLKSKNK